MHVSGKLVLIHVFGPCLKNPEEAVSSSFRVDTFLSKKDLTEYLDTMIFV